MRCFGKFLRACGDLPMRDDDETRAGVSAAPTVPHQDEPGPCWTKTSTDSTSQPTDDNKSKLRSKARALIDWWLNEFLVGLISLRSHHKLTRPHPLHRQTYICDCYCYFLAQLSFVNCGLAERVLFVCVFRLCSVCVCYVATGNGILQSHAHVSAGCLCSFSLIKPGSQQPRGLNAPNWISISQVNWVTKVDSCCKHRYIQIMDKGKQYTHRQASCLFPFKFHALCILTGYCSSIYTNIWRL